MENGQSKQWWLDITDTSKKCIPCTHYVRKPKQEEMQPWTCMNMYDIYLPTWILSIIPRINGIQYMKKKNPITSVPFHIPQFLTISYCILLYLAKWNHISPTYKLPCNSRGPISLPSNSLPFWGPRTRVRSLPVWQFDADYIPWRIHGTWMNLATWIGKYKSPMDPMGYLEWGLFWWMLFALGGPELLRHTHTHTLVMVFPRRTPGGFELIFLERCHCGIKSIRSNIKPTI